MKIVIAPDSFKESMPAAQAAEAMALGARRACPDAEIVVIPLADGGEGTTDALVAATGGRFVEATASGPLGRPVRAKIGLLGDGRTAIVETAAASGLALVPPRRRNPMIATSFGTGQLIRIALDAGARRLIIAVGGSATVDGGAGLAEALGIRFLDSAGRPIARGGQGLASVAAVDASGMDEKLKRCKCIVACDVSNPLCGPSGAAAVYGPQKGATPKMVPLLDAGLRRLAGVIRNATGCDLADAPGMGAAGGIPLCLAAFLNAELKPGIEIVLQAADFSRRIRGADLIITGEGRLDAQSAFGKTVCGVARAAAKARVPAIALAGAVAPGAEALLAEGLTAFFSIAPGPMSLKDALAEAPRLAANCAEQVVRAFVAGRGARRAPARPVSLRRREPRSTLNAPSPVKRGKPKP